MAITLTTTYQQISASGLYYGSTHIGYLRLYAKYNSQSIANNQTYGTAKLTFELIPPYTDVSTQNVNTNLVGITQSLGTQTYYRGETTLQEETFTISHNEDGTSKQRGITGGFDSTVVRASGVGDFVVAPKIDRYPYLINAPSFNDGASPTITYSTINGFVDSTVQVAIYNNDESVALADYRDVVVADGSYTFSFTQTEIDRFQLYCTGQNLPIKYVLRTTASGTNYYSKKTATYNMVDAYPTFNVAYKDTNNTTKAITNNDQQIIQNKSTLQINITNASAKKGASVSSVEVEINGVITTSSISGTSKNINVGTIDLSNNITSHISLIDSRGFRTTQNLDLTILGWSKPTAITTLNRQQNFYTETDITVDANYSSLDSKNTITIKYRIKKTSEGSYGAWNNLSDNVQSTFNADNTYAWDIQVYVEDRLDNNTYDYSIGIGTPIFFIDRNLRSISVNCFPARSSSVEVNGKDISNTYSTTEEIPIGTWVDGKTIYRKSIYISSLPNATQQDYNFTDYGINPTKLIKLEGMAYLDSGGQFPINGVRTNTNAQFSMWASITSSSKTFSILVGADRRSCEAYIHVEYLKD